MAKTLDDVVTELVTLNGRVAALNLGVETLNGRIEVVEEYLVDIEANTGATANVAPDVGAMRVGVTSLYDAVLSQSKGIAAALALEDRVRRV